MLRGAVFAVIFVPFTPITAEISVSPPMPGNFPCKVETAGINIKFAVLLCLFYKFRAAMILDEIHYLRVIIPVFDKLLYKAIDVVQSVQHCVCHLLIKGMKKHPASGEVGAL